jgi:hypothetical protein
MSLRVFHKYTTVAGTPPASGDIDVGEIAINAADVALYLKDTGGSIRNAVTDAPFSQAGAGAIARTVESKLRDVVSVKDFGAVGDGVTDDTTAIQAALDAGGSNAWSLYFPKGVYIISAPLSAGRRTSIEGDGWDSSVRAANNANLPYLIQFGGSGAITTGRITNIEFQGNKDNNPTALDGVIVVNGYKFTADRLRVAFCKRDGLVLSAPGTCFENYFSGLSVYANGEYGVRMTGTITDSHIFDSDIGYNGKGGVVLATSCSLNQSTIWGGGIEESIGVVTAGISLQIVGNRIEGHGQHGIKVSANNDYAYIANNKIYANSFSAATDGQYDGIYIDANADYGTITGNKVYGAASSATPYSTRYAINFAGAHNQWTIQGNDLPLLNGGSPLSLKTSGPIVNGVLASDKCDFNWIRTNVLARANSGFNATAAFAFVELPLDVEDSDVLSEFNNGSFTPKNSGLYRFEVKVTLTAAAANESLIVSLCDSSGAEIRRIHGTRSVSVNSTTIGGAIEEFLTAGTAYSIRYNVGSTSTAFLAGAAYTYARVRAIAN